MNSKIKEFIQSCKSPRIKVHEAGIPTGIARTRGHGDPGYVAVLICDKGFANRKSKHYMLEMSDTVRRDYGAIRGHYAQVLQCMHALAKTYAEELGLPLE